MKKKIVFIVGPTAVGKTEAAVCIAKKLKAEIISCDSMQIYKGMDIITSKPAPALRAKVPHYLISMLSLTKEYNVSEYRKEALKIIKKIIKRGKLPLFVGGTGLYMSILVDGLFEGGKENKEIRARLYKQAEALGSNYLYKKLQDVDPEAAGKIHPNDLKRIVRALEVFKATGKPISYLQKQRKGLAAEYDVTILCLNMEREILYKRIGERVDKMFESGLLKEVKRLLKSKLSRTASGAIGIKELKGYFDGLYGLEEAKELMKRNSRVYAKRQLTWFRKDKRIKWIEAKEKEKPADLARRIWKELY